MSLIITALTLALLTAFVPALANGIDAPSDTEIQKIQHYDIAELMMKKYPIQVEERTFNVLYRLSTTLESLAEDSGEDYDARMVSMGINPERLSLIIKLDNILQSDVMSVRFPQELLSADKEKFTILVNGKEKGYEFSVSGKYTNLIFIVPSQTTEVEIIGTKVIPEFTGSLLILAAATSLLFAYYRFGAKSKTLF